MPEQARGFWTPREEYESWRLARGDTTTTFDQWYATRTQRPQTTEISPGPALSPTTITGEGEGGGETTLADILDRFSGMLAGSQSKMMALWKSMYGPNQRRMMGQRMPSVLSGGAGIQSETVRRPTLLGQGGSA